MASSSSSGEHRMEDGRQDFAHQMLRLSRSASLDAGDRHYSAQKGMPPPYQHPPKGYGGYRMPPVGYPGHGSQQMAYHHQPHHHHFQPQTRHPQRLHSVITSSFSVDDEREDVGDRFRGYATRKRHAAADESRHPEGPANREGADEEMAEEREAQQRESFRREPPVIDGRVQAPDDAKAAKPVRIPLSPAEGGHARARQQEQTTPMAAHTTKVSPDSLKRNFWHHSRPVDMSSPKSVHPAFVPPKRAKTRGDDRKRKEVVISPRTPRNESTPGSSSGYGPMDHWGGRPEEEHIYNNTPYHKPPLPVPWARNRPSPPYGYYDVKRASSMDEFGRSWSSEEPSFGRAPVDRASQSAFRSIHNRFPQVVQFQQPLPRQGSFPPPISRQWRGSFDGSWGSMPPTQSDPAAWNSMHPQHRDDVDSRDLRSRSYSREMPWDERDSEMRRSYDNSFHRVPYYPHQPQVDSSNPLNSPSNMLKPGSDIAKTDRDGPLALLAQPEDRISLSETLCTIRENIEVFTATKADVDAPAPGRKHPVTVGQVGLRCIHCRHTTKSSERVKRAVCYPSSIKRIYRTVIDMKLDHFQHCRFVPKALKDRLEELKAINTRSTGTTMQYFVKAAKKMGMVDGTSGVRLAENKQDQGGDGSPPGSPDKGNAPHSPPSASKQAGKSEVLTQVTPMSESEKVAIKRSPSDASSEPSIGAASDSSIHDEPQTCFTGKVPLALPEDTMALSPLRCFLRENVFAFSATDEDIAVRTPTTFSVVEGQVGICCIHCHSLPAKERSNRAVCFPFSINRIYQSVADIQRFHLGECKMVPPKVREKFQALQSASSKGSKGLATRQYWVTSAKKIGLVDTKRGIRFSRDPSVPATQAVSLDILAQVASNVTTVDRPLVLPEDKPCIAEFLYVVMEQLQPCRFTEADRNKRRLKDVGCIGVECKHCAGQVESRKFFWSSVNAVESNFVSVHTHMMECRMVPKELKEQLAELKKLRKEQTARLKTGSQKSFFQRVWKRLHGEDKGKKTPQAEDKGVQPKVEAVSEDMQKMAVVSV